MCLETYRTVIRVATLALVMMALVACGQQPETTTHESVALETLLTYGENQYIIDKYSLEGHDTREILKMLKAVGQDGVERWPDHAADLRARGFSLAPDLSPMKQRSAPSDMEL